MYPSPILSVQDVYILQRSIWTSNFQLVHAVSKVVIPADEISGSAAGIVELLLQDYLSELIEQPYLVPALWLVFKLQVNRSVRDRVREDTDGFCEIANQHLHNRSRAGLTIHVYTLHAIIVVPLNRLGICKNIYRIASIVGRWRSYVDRRE